MGLHVDLSKSNIDLCLCVSVLSKIAGDRHDLSAGEGHIPCSSNSSINSLVKVGK